MDDKPIAEARANLTELVANVRLLRRPVHLSRRGKPQAAIVPVELADAAEAVGGSDAATEILRKHAGQQALTSPAASTRSPHPPQPPQPR